MAIQEEVTNSIWTCEVGYILGTECQDPWCLSGSGSGRSDPRDRSRFGTCKHLENPDIEIVKEVCVERI